MLKHNLFHIYWIWILISCNLVNAYPYDALIPRETTASNDKPVPTASGSAPAEPATTSALPSKTNAGGSTQTGKGTVTSATKGGKGSSTITEIPDSANVGLISMQTPALTDGSQYYGIGDYVTLAWNYTNLIIPPRVRVQAFNSKNSAYYDIASNLSVSQTSIVWDTNMQRKIQSIPFVPAWYTLLIYDENLTGGATAVPTPGYLAPQKNYRFAMYSRAPEVPLSDFTCPTCDTNAASTIEKNLLKFMIGTSLVMSFSFTYFLGVFL